MPLSISTSVISIQLGIQYNTIQCKGIDRKKKITDYDDANNVSEVRSWGNMLSGKIQVRCNLISYKSVPWHRWPRVATTERTSKRHQPSTN